MKRIKKIIKKPIVMATILALAVSVSSFGISFASSESELRGELDDVQDEKDAIGNEMKEVKKKADAAEATIAELNEKVYASKVKIQKVSKSIEKKEAEIEEQEENLGQRLRAMYKRGSVGFLDILLGSGSISEFVSNTELIQKLYKSDVEVMESLEKENNELKETKKELEAQKSSLDSQVEKVNQKQKELDELYGQLEAKEAQLEKEADRISEEIQSLIDAQSQYSGGQFRWPVPSSQYITSYYGYRVHPVYGTPDTFHRGIDIGASYGSSIVAAASGTVISSYYNYYGYGNMVLIDHGGGITTLYAHASSRLVSVGEKVQAGQTIALIGSTGLSTGPHLHFEVREGSSTVDPLGYLS